MEAKLNEQIDQSKTEIKKTNLKPCCVCTETRTFRDDCLRFNDEDKCLKEIESHIKCLESYGFKI